MKDVTSIYLYFPDIEFYRIAVEIGLNLNR